MPRQPVRTDGAPHNPSYSQAVKPGGLIFVSGQGPFDPVSGTIVDVPGLRLSISAIAEA